MNNEIIIFENQNVKLEVNMKERTVWLTANQMAKLFDKDEKTIRKHINNIFKDEELDKNDNNTQKMRVEGVKQIVPFYNLDVIISVGYRVHSKNGIIFRKWATKILEDYLIQGYVVNKQRLEYLEKTIKLLDIATRTNNDDETSKILNVINNYSKGLDLLDHYDHRDFSKIKGNTSDEKITYKNCIDLISLLKYNETSEIFALERDRGLESIINNIYQTFNGEEVYKTLEEKAANLLYMVVKNHTFIDGNKRIAATLFIYFLYFYNMLYKDSDQTVDNNTLAAITILIAESNPKEKEIMIDLIMHIIKE